MKTRRGQRSVVLLTSPSADRVANLPELLQGAGMRIAERIPVGQLDPTRPLGATWRQRGYACVVAAGGDGTVGAAVSQIAGSGLPLGILPMGTSNDVARSLGCPLDLVAACTVIGEGVATAVDVGMVSPLVAPSPFGQKLREIARRRLPVGSLRRALVGPEMRFIHAVTLGLNVEFARLATDVARRQRWGPLNYATATMEALMKLRPVAVALHLSGVHTPGTQAKVSDHDRAGTGGVETEARHPREPGDELALSCQAVQVAVVNTSVFGGPLNLRIPAAQPRDRLLDILVIEALEPQLLRKTVESLLTALSALGESYRPGSRLPRPPSEVVTEASGASGETGEEADAAAHTLLMTGEAARFALPGVHHYQARSVQITAPVGVEMTLDGEIGARTPATIALAREQVRVLLSREAQQRLAGQGTSVAATSGGHR